MKFDQQMKIRPAQACVDSAGFRFKHLVVELAGSQEIAAVRETPECWTAIQSDAGLALRRGDKVTVVSADGLTIGDSFVVTRAEGGKVYLGKPLRMIELEPTALYSDGVREVVAVGTGYGVRNIRSARLDGNVTFPTARAAESALHKMAGTQQVA